MVKTAARVKIEHGPGVAAIVAALGAARFVGGCVRDAMAGQSATDIDLATPLPPAEVMAQLEGAGIKVIPTGLDHGTVTAVAQGETVEITTLRRDVATDGRRATIAYTDDWREDAARRDFTINALYADPETGAVTDYFGGVDDLAAGIVRFIGPPLARIAEDHLRILRFFRFHARFGKAAPDPEGLAACAARANDLMALSRERIADELLKILALADPAPIVALMIAHGIFAPVLPEIVAAAPLARLIPREAECGGDPVRRLASLLPADPRCADEVSARLKLSRAQRKRLNTAAARVTSDQLNPEALAYWLGKERAVDRLLLGEGDANALANWVSPIFPLTGGAIVARGVLAGPEVARILSVVEHQWVAEGFPDAGRVSAIADAVIAR
ncbi:MAG: hypothetical protein RIS52_1526 [Pseudomonadota bacterium]